MFLDFSASLDTAAGFADDAYQQLDAEIADFDLIFAFPWPNDEELTARMFERFGADGALLLTYCEQDSVRLRRK